MLDKHPHIQGLLVGTALLGAAAAGLPAALHAAQDLFATSDPGATVASSDQSPKLAHTDILAVHFGR